MKQPTPMEVPQNVVPRDYHIREYSVQVLREMPTTKELRVCDTPHRAAAYWRTHIAMHPYYNRDVECFAIILLDTRRNAQGHHLVTHGVKDKILVDPGGVFRVPIMNSAACIILLHNHPSGDPTPSDADIKVTRDLFRAGEMLRIEVADHVIIGDPCEKADTNWRKRGYCSLREIGYLPK